MKTFGKILRVVAIVLMAMTAGMNVLGGIGTSCAAFFTKKYPPYWVLIRPVDYRWLYQLFVVATLLIGIAGIYVMIGLIRGGKHAYRNTLIVLLVGTAVNAIHYITSMNVIGKAAPANVVFYINLITLLFFLLLLIPGLRENTRFSGGKKADRAIGGGAAALVTGILVLSTHAWVGSSHVFQGSNWVDLLSVPIYATGTFLTLVGLGVLAAAAWKTETEFIVQAETQAI